LRKHTTMAKIILFGNMKGGVGKSQVTVMTATALSAPPFNYKVLVLDIDKQRSIERLRKLDIESYPPDTAPPYQVRHMIFEDLQKEISNLDQLYDFIFIDTPGALDNNRPIQDQELTKVLMYVDALFIPFVAGNHNLTATLEYLQFCKKVQAARILSKRQLSIYGFINMHRSRSRVNQFLIDDLEAITGDIQLLKNYLNDYTLFREADTIQSIYSDHSSDPAKINFAAWLNELITIN